jgi:hypothetical protein
LLCGVDSPHELFERVHACTGRAVVTLRSPPWIRALITL